MSQLVNPVAGRISSRYGPRTHPITGKRTPHTGTDIAAPSGTPVRAAHAGVVTASRRDGSRGNWVGIRGDAGPTTYYLHLSRRRVTEGARVSAGSHVGDVGSTGTATGPHLHFEVWTGSTHTDPQAYYRARGLTLGTAGSATGGASRPVLREGSAGQHVRDLQQHLKTHYPAYARDLAVDGNFGPKTRAVVTEYQHRAGLDPDGVVGPITWASLGLD